MRIDHPLFCHKRPLASKAKHRSARCLRPRPWMSPGYPKTPPRQTESIPGRPGPRARWELRFQKLGEDRPGPFGTAPAYASEKGQQSARRCHEDAATVQSSGDRIHPQPDHGAVLSLVDRLDILFFPSIKLMGWLNVDFVQVPIRSANNYLSRRSCWERWIPRYAFDPDTFQSRKQFWLS